MTEQTTGQQWRISVDRDTCIGSGICAAMASAYFTLDDDRSRPITEVVDPQEDVRDAAESCPVEAILIRAADTGEVLAPEP